MATKRFFYEPSKRPRPYGDRRPLFKSSSILSYTENDLAIMARFTGNGKMAQAADLFARMTPSELKMQEIFQSERFKSHPCYPQTIAFGYILDFYFPFAGLAVEVDGPIHDKQKSYDRRRDSQLKGRGITTLRITNQAFHDNREAVISAIERKLSDLVSQHS